MKHLTRCSGHRNVQPSKQFYPVASLSWSSRLLVAAMQAIGQEENPRELLNPTVLLALSSRPQGMGKILIMCPLPDITNQI